MGFDQHPPQWQLLRERPQSPMSLPFHTSRRSRTIFLISTALFCTWLLSGFVTSLPQQYPLLEQHADRVKTPTTTQLTQHIVLDGEATISTAVETQNIDPASTKIGKITMLYGEPNPTYERALQSHIHHAKLHHYALFVLRQKLLGRLWSKPAYILSRLLLELEKPDPASRLDWLFWFDADTYLLNPKTPLSIFLPRPSEMPHINLLCTNDHNGLNDGAFFLRVNDWSLHLMAAALSLEELRPSVDLKYSEQSAIEHLVEHEPLYMNHTAMVPQRWFNAFMGPREWDGRVKKGKQIEGNSVVEGDLLVHFAGRGDTKRGRMNRFMDAFEKDKGRWEMEIGETEIEGEMREFWEGWAVVERERGGREMAVPEESERSLGVGSEGGEMDAMEGKANQENGQETQSSETEERPKRRW